MRAYSFQSVQVFLHGANGGTGYIPIPGQLPIKQPWNERALQLPQTVGFNVQVPDPDAVTALQLFAFRVELGDGS